MGLDCFSVVTLTETQNRLNRALNSCVRYVYGDTDSVSFITFLLEWIQSLVFHSNLIDFVTRLLCGSQLGYLADFVVAGLSTRDSCFHVPSSGNHIFRDFLFVEGIVLRNDLPRKWKRGLIPRFVAVSHSSCFTWHIS